MVSVELLVQNLMVVHFQTLYNVQMDYVLNTLVNVLDLALVHIIYLLDAQMVLVELHSLIVEEDIELT
jgi:hypothetical protein